MSDVLLLTRYRLSWRERDVFCLQVMGYTSKEIAKLLNISVHTVITYRARIGAKMNLSGQSEFREFILKNKLF